MSDEQDKVSPKTLVLEETDAAPEPSISNDPIDPILGSILGGDPFALTTAKYVALDGLLRLLTRDLKFTEFMREALLLLMRVVKSEAGSILEVDPGNRCLFFRAVVGQSSDQVTRFTIPLGQGIAGYVTESLRPLVVDDVAENRVHLKAIERVVGFETRNLAAFPIVVRGKAYGVIELLNRVGEAGYGPADIETLTYLSEAVARAIEIRAMIAWGGNSSGGTRQEDAA